MSIINGHWTDKLGNLFDSPPGSIIGPMNNQQYAAMQQAILADSQMQQKINAAFYPLTQREYQQVTSPPGWTAADEATYQKYLFTGVLEP